MRNSIILTALALLFSCNLVSGIDPSCSIGLSEPSLGMHAVVETCSNIGSFSLGGLYGGVWEKLTYNYPSPWKGTFISVNVDGKVYSTSENPFDSVLMDDYVSSRPGLFDEVLETEWILPENIQVTQSFMNIENNTLVNLSIVNRDSASHVIGVRVHLDTMLGLNDGAPIYIPGHGLRTKEVAYGQNEISFEYWKAYNTPDKPTIVATGLIDPKRSLTLPSQIIVSEWKKSNNAGWQYRPSASQSILGDSAVIIYYDLGIVGPGLKDTVLLSVGGLDPVLPVEKGSFGITEVFTQKISGDYCPGDTVDLIVDVLSEGGAREGIVDISITRRGSEVHKVSRKITAADGKVTSVAFLWKIDDEGSLGDAVYTVTAALTEDGKIKDSRSRSDLIRVDHGKCGVRESSAITSVIYSGLYILPVIVILAVLFIIIVLLYRSLNRRFEGEVRVEKSQDNEEVRLVVVNDTGKTMDEVVVEDLIPENSEIAVSTLNVVRKKDRLFWHLGDLKPGAQAILEYRIKDKAIAKNGVVRWLSGEKEYEIS
ncbi:hypothetical protein ACFLRF_02195 [Candidatus Altiarchaeota archaeon]